MITAARPCAHMERIATIAVRRTRETYARMNAFTPKIDFAMMAARMIHFRVIVRSGPTATTAVQEDFHDFQRPRKKLFERMKDHKDGTFVQIIRTSTEKQMQVQQKRQKKFVHLGQLQVSSLRF